VRLGATLARQAKQASALAAIVLTLLAATTCGTVKRNPARVLCDCVIERARPRINSP
jgi:hypothetical protein